MTAAAVGLACAVGALLPGPASADYVPGACSGGLAGVICAPGSWSQPDPTSNTYFGAIESPADFPSGSGNWILTFWFRSQVPGQPDQAFSDPVSMWAGLGFVNLPVAAGQDYTAWATLDRQDGNGPVLTDSQTEVSGEDWSPTTTLTFAPGELASLCLSAADASQISAGAATGCIGD